MKAAKIIRTAIETKRAPQEQNSIEYWLRRYGMPKENIEYCVTEIAQGYGACRYLEGVSDGAEAVIEKETKQETNKTTTTMKKYNYEITYVNGKTAKLTGCTERINTKYDWITIRNDNGIYSYINMRNVICMEETECKKEE